MASYGLAIRTSSNSATHSFLKEDILFPSHGGMLCHDVSHTSKQCAASDKQLVQIENKCGWMEEAKSRIPLKHVCCHFIVIHLDLLPPSSRTQSLRSVDNYEQRSPGKDGGGRQTDGQG